MEIDGVVNQAIAFLLNEFLEEVGAKYGRYIQYASQEKNQVLRESFEEEKERLETKLTQAKAFLKVLKIAGR